MADRDIPRDDAEAALNARRDLGPEYEPAVVDSFVEQLDAVIDKRVEERLERLRADGQLPADTGDSRSDHTLALAIVTLALAIPLTAIAGQAGLVGMLLAWFGLVSVNAVYAISLWNQRKNR